MVAAAPERGCTLCDGCASFSPSENNERLCNKRGCGHRETQHVPCLRKQYKFPGDQLDRRCGECGLYPSAHVEAEDAPCSLTQEQFRSMPFMVLHGRCSECGLGVGSHTLMPAKRARDDVYVLRGSVPRGATFQHLRRRVFALAEDCHAYDGAIAYSTPVTCESNLDIELYFADRHCAVRFETVLLQAVRDKWKSDSLPICDIAEVEHELQHRIFAHRYQQMPPSPERDTFEFMEEETRSPRTTVLDDDEIDAESVVHRHGTSLKFEKCHIVADLKNTPDDTTGNHIPLPSDWHDLFDAYTCDRVAGVSIVATEVHREELVRADGRVRVLVHVYFNPSSPDGPAQIAKLREAASVRPNVYAVSVFKREPEIFCERLQQRHDQVLQNWPRVP